MARVSLTIDGKDGVHYNDTPVTFGIPFPEGELHRDDTVRLVDDNSGVIPAQTKCLTTWTPDGDYIKWLLVDAQLSLEPEAKSNLFLEYGDDVETVPGPDQPVNIQEDGGSYLEINTGPMEFRIRTQFNDHWNKPSNPDFIKACRAGEDEEKQELFGSSPGPHLYMDDQNGNSYDSYSAGPPPEVSIEERGPIRACIRIDGHHVMEEGPKFCPYTLRLHFFAGSSDIRMQHTFTFDQEPYQTELSSVGIQFPLRLGDNLRAAVGGSEEVHWTTNFEELQYLQRDDQEYEVVRNGEKYGSGDRPNGWASLNGDRGGMAAVIKNAWQEYPAGFTLDSEGIDVGIWPDHYEENLTFTTPFDEPAIAFDTRHDEEYLGNEDAVKRRLEENPTAPVNLRSFGADSLEDIEWIEDVMAKYAPDRPKSYNDIPFWSNWTDSHNGVGASKTTEIYLRLNEESIPDEEAASLARTVQSPLMVRADPEYMCQTGAFPHVYPAGDSRFEETDAGLEDIYRMVAKDPVERCRLYGKMRYGDMVCAHSGGAAGLAYLYYKDEDPEKALRYVGAYHNEVADQITATWHAFVRTGSRENFFIAKQFSETAADVAFIHAHPTNPEKVGLSRRHNGHVWSGTPVQSHTVIRGLLINYYLTGNHRLLDVATEAADRIVSNQEPAGILSNREGGLTRSFTTPLSVLLDAYQATWEEQYGILAERSLNWLLRTIEEPPMFPTTLRTAGERGDEAVVKPPCYPTRRWGNMYYVYLMASRLFPSQFLEEQIVAEADWFTQHAPLEVDGGGTARNVELHYGTAIINIAYEMTGDPSYAAYANHLLQNKFAEVVEKYRSEEILGFQDLWYNFTIPHLMNVVAKAEDEKPEEFKNAKEEWRQTREGPTEEYQSWSRPDRASDESLGRLSTDPR